jgi:hypothetical protein
MRGLGGWDLHKNISRIEASIVLVWDLSDFAITSGYIYFLVSRCWDSQKLRGKKTKSFFLLTFA